MLNLKTNHNKKFILSKAFCCDLFFNFNTVLFFVYCMVDYIQLRQNYRVITKSGYLQIDQSALPLQV